MVLFFYKVYFQKFYSSFFFTCFFFLAEPYPKKYDSSHILCVFFMHWLSKSSFLINSQRVATSVLAQRGSKAGSSRMAGCRPIRASESISSDQAPNFATPASL